VWSRGKGGDNFKTLPIAINTFYSTVRQFGRSAKNDQLKKRREAAFLPMPKGGGISPRIL